MKNKFFQLVMLFISVSFILISCNDYENETKYPKEVQITYKVTSTNTATAQAISYKNETGGMTTLSNVALPFSKTITRIVNKNDDASLGYSTTTETSNITLEIQVDNSIKKNQKFISVSGAIVYLFY